MKLDVFWPQTLADFNGTNRPFSPLCLKKHVMRTGSDVCHELFEILPRLAKGVYVHIHDMFWPFEYPRSWVIDDNRSWNELYGVRAFLTNNDSWRVVMFNDYMRLLETDLIRSTHPEFF